MIRFVSSDDIATETKMIRSAFKGSILLVEGDTDSKFFNKFVDSQVCYILPAHNKENVIQAVEKLELSGFCGVIGIVDPDFWRVDESIPKIPDNLVLIEVHDLEILLIASPAFDRVLIEYGSKTKIDKFKERTMRGNVRDLILQSALPFGVMRYISQRHKHNWTFEGLKYERYVNRTTLEVDLKRLILGVLSLSDRSAKEAYLIELEIQNNLDRLNAELLQICCGHDSTSIFCIALRNLIGNQTSHVAVSSNIESALRLSFDFEDLKRTELYSNVKLWEEHNMPYRVFND